ncbi:tetratricopeptide repeat-containing sulfotransferase family protein [Magnetospira thiophila]
MPDRPRPLRKLFEQAQKALARGASGEALRHCVKALGSAPNDPEILNLAGVACCQLAEAKVEQRIKRLDEGIGYFQRAAIYAPEWVLPYSSLGHACRERGRPLAAEKAFVAALARAADDPATLLGLAQGLIQIGCPKQAEPVLRRIASQQKVGPSARLALIGLLADTRRHDDALAEARRLAEDFPDWAEAHFRLGEMLAEAGDFDAARQAMTIALHRDPRHAVCLLRLALITRFAEDDSLIAPLRDLAEAQNPPQIRSPALFALGKAHDDRGEADLAMACWTEANALYRPQIGYDVASDMDYMERIEAAFPAERIQRLAALGSPSDAPLFIVGLPRSGTTLVEQILARHPEITAGGELVEFERALLRTLEQSGIDHPYPKGFESFPDSGWLSLAETYLERAQPEGSRRFTDKLPLNALHLPLLAITFPRAPIIYCTRDLPDVGLSLFQQMFARGNLFSYDLAEIGTYMARFSRFMAHWSSALPGRLVRVDYDQLVADPAGQSALLYQRCGLEGTPAEKSPQGPIRTASQWQARQKVFTSSSGRWEKYRDHLAPMLTALENGQNM